MAEVVLSRVGKVYPDGTRAVTDLSLDIADGEFLVLVGPSGCGKTTALRMVAGLEDISEGSIRIGDKVVNRVPPRDRDVAMVFQSYALYPHLKVRDNIAFGLQLRKMPKKEIRTRVEKAAEILGLSDHLDRKPRHLSGGQRQRVAMGRAIVREPQAFLMDEPLSNLDAKLRVQMRAEIARIQRDLGVTTIYVTHDQTEAMTLGDRVAVMRRGMLQQIANPQVLYDHPENLFVAAFIGSPAMNLVRARLERMNSDEFSLRLAGDQTIVVPHAVVKRRPALASYVGQSLIMGVRPEDMADAELDPASGGATLVATADLVEAMGSDVFVHFTLDAPPVVTDDTKEIARDVGTDVGVSKSEFERHETTELIARFNPRTRARERERVSARIDTERLHFFDADTGASIWDEEARTPVAASPVATNEETRL